MITSKDNQQLKTIRKLLSKRRDGLFVAEGEDLIGAADANGWEPVILGPDCADPYGPKAVRASMGSIFSRPPAKARFETLTGTTIALDHRAKLEVADVKADPPLILCVGGERRGLPIEVKDQATTVASIKLRPDGPDSLNAAVSAAIALYRMAADA